MFGFLRFYLAILVVVTHISTFLDHGGGFAVYSFYILSGYLMTYVMNNTYGYSASGIGKYLINRFLRIYPPYWVVCILTLIGIYFCEDFFYAMHKSLRSPETTHEILSNVFILGLFPAEGGEAPMARLVPAAWALHVEVCFYLAIAFFLGKFRSLVALWLCVSATYHVVAIKYDLPRYAPVYAASLPFSLGAFIYHFKHRANLAILFNAYTVLATLVLFIAFALGAGKLPVATSVYPFYANMLLTSILILQLGQDWSGRYRVLRKADNFLGGLSYPIYLSHWLVAATVGFMFDIHKSNELLFVTIPFLVIFSVSIKYLVDDPLENLRRIVSERARYSSMRPIPQGSVAT